MEEKECCCTGKTKARTEEEYRSLIHRLSRIEGQVRGIRAMVEKGAYCTDILTQSAAVSAALSAFDRELLGNHIRTCVADDIRAGHDEVIDELLDTGQERKGRKAASFFCSVDPPVLKLGQVETASAVRPTND